MSRQTGQDDVVALLVAQHEQIRSLFQQVDKAAGSEVKRQRFEELRRLLAVHETAEELIVHPEARRAKGGSAVVDARIEEERDAKELLVDLDAMRVTDEGFDDRLALLRQAVMDHASHEEHQEFPLLRQHTDQKTLARMASAVRAAEAMAPTHPHPGVESMTANLLLGPVASLVDRTRDAVRAALGRD